MPTLLIGWELGGGAGHIHRLIPIISRHLQHGWKVVTALRMRQAALEHFVRKFAAHLAEERLIVVQAPIFLHRASNPTNACSLAEIFAHIGFADMEKLRPVVSAWERLLSLYRPEIIISDMAPSLNLAASGRLPVIVIGNGWTIPPDADQPALFEHQIGAAGSATTASLRVIETAFKLTGGRHASGRFSDLLRARANFVCTLQAFDPYASERHERYFWPFEISLPSSEKHIRNRGFIYLPRAHPALASVLAAVSAAKVEFDGYFGGFQPVVRNLFTATQPYDLPNKLPTAQIAIHHGGLGTAIECWMYGVPQLICPLDSEKLIIAQRLQDARAGQIFLPNSKHKNLGTLIEALCHQVTTSPDVTNMATGDPEETLRELYRESQSILSRQQI